LSKDIEIIKIFVAIQDVKVLDKYNVYLIEVRKQISTNKLLIVYLAKKNMHPLITHKEVYKLARESEFDLCISSIEQLTKDSKHLSLYGYKYEHEMIVQYIENFNSIVIEGLKAMQLDTKKQIFLLDTDSQSNKWKWDIYQIKPITIALMIAIQFGIRRRQGALLHAFNLLAN